MLLDYSEGVVTTLRELYAADKLTTANRFADEAVYVRSTNKTAAETRKAVEKALVQETEQERAARYQRAFKSKFKTWLANPWNVKDLASLQAAILKRKERKPNSGSRFGEIAQGEDQRVPATELMLRIAPEALAQLAKLPPGTKLVVGRTPLGLVPALASPAWPQALTAFNQAQAKVGPVANLNPEISGFLGGQIASSVSPATGAYLEVQESWGHINITLLAVDNDRNVLGLARTSFRDEPETIDLPTTTAPLPARIRRIAEAFAPAPILAPHFGAETPRGKRILIPLTTPTQRIDPAPAYALREHHPVKSFVGDPVAAMIPGQNVIALLDADTVSGMA